MTQPPSEPAAGIDMDALVAMLKKYIRVKGGNVQRVLGSGE